MSKLKSVILFALIVLISSSCSKKSDTIPLEAVGDVFYVNKNVDATKVTALSFYVFGNKAIKNTVVTLPFGETKILDKSKNNRFTLFAEPVESDFKTSYPDEGEYIFDIESQDGDDQLKSTDHLTKQNLPIPEISKITFEENDASYDLEWDAIDAADQFQIKLFDQNHNEIFESKAIEKGTSFFTLIPGDLGTWTGNIETGQTYTIQLWAIVFDEDAILSAPEGDVTSPLFNIQEISIGEQTFVWNEQ